MTQNSSHRSIYGKWKSIKSDGYFDDYMKELGKNYSV